MKIYIIQLRVFQVRLPSDKGVLSLKELGSFKHVHFCFKFGYTTLTSSLTWVNNYLFWDDISFFVATFVQKNNQMLEHFLNFWTISGWCLKPNSCFSLGCPLCSLEIMKNNLSKLIIAQILLGQMSPWTIIPWINVLWKNISLDKYHHTMFL